MHPITLKGLEKIVENAREGIIREDIKETVEFYIKLSEKFEQKARIEYERAKTLKRRALELYNELKVILNECGERGRDGEKIW